MSRAGTLVLLMALAHCAMADTPGWVLLNRRTTDSAACSSYTPLQYGIYEFIRVGSTGCLTYGSSATEATAYATQTISGTQVLTTRYSSANCLSGTTQTYLNPNCQAYPLKNGGTATGQYIVSIVLPLSDIYSFAQTMEGESTGFQMVTSWSPSTTCGSETDWIRRDYYKIDACTPFVRLYSNSLIQGSPSTSPIGPNVGDISLVWVTKTFKDGTAHQKYNVSRYCQDPAQYANPCGVHPTTMADDDTLDQCFTGTPSVKVTTKPYTAPPPPPSPPPPAATTTSTTSNATNSTTGPTTTGATTTTSSGTTGTTSTSSTGDTTTSTTSGASGSTSTTGGTSGTTSTTGGTTGTTSSTTSSTTALSDGASTSSSTSTTSTTSSTTGSTTSSTSGSENTATGTEKIEGKTTATTGDATSVIGTAQVIGIVIAAAVAGLGALGGGILVVLRTGCCRKKNEWTAQKAVVKFCEMNGRPPTRKELASAENISVPDKSTDEKEWDVIYRGLAPRGIIDWEGRNGEFGVVPDMTTFIELTEYMKFRKSDAFVAAWEANTSPDDVAVAMKVDPKSPIFRCAVHVTKALSLTTRAGVSSTSASAALSSGYDSDSNSDSSSP